MSIAHVKVLKIISYTCVCYIYFLNSVTNLMLTMDF